MPVSVPVPTKNPGDLLTSALWNSSVRDNLNKLLDRGHRVLTVAQFGALTGLEDGDEVYLEVDAANDIQWHLRYKTSTSRWRFLGGPAMYSAVETSEAVGGVSYADLATVGPSLTMPRAGVMEVNYGAHHSGNSNGEITALKIGAAATSDAEAIYGYPTGGASPSRRFPKTVAANDVLKLQYRGVSASGGTFAKRWLAVNPRWLT